MSPVRMHGLVEVETLIILNFWRDAISIPPVGWIMRSYPFSLKKQWILLLFFVFVSFIVMMSGLMFWMISDKLSIFDSKPFILMA